MNRKFHQFRGTWPGGLRFCILFDTEDQGNAWARAMRCKVSEVKVVRFDNLSHSEVNPSNDFTGFVDQGQYVLDLLQ